jgi:hypothetical protein
MSTPLPLYRPSNGSEGDGFYAEWCGRCERDRAFREADGDAAGCLILSMTLALETDHPDYPREWVEHPTEGPKCTAFVEEGGRVPTDREVEAMGQATFFGEAAA